MVLSVNVLIKSVEKFALLFNCLNCTYCCIIKPLLSVSRVDINKDRSVSAKEMQRWIMEKTEEHFQEAVRENKLSFRAVDPDQDGRCILLFRPVSY